MEGQLDAFKNLPDSPKCDLVQVKVDELNGPLASPEFEAKVEEVKQPTVSPKVDILKVKVEEVKQPSISSEGAMNESSSNRWEVRRVFMTYLLFLNLYFVPVRLHEVYETDGLISRRFAYYTLCAFMFLLVYIASFEMIGHRTFAALMLPAMIGFIATWEWDLQLCIALGVFLVLFIIIMSLVVICDKTFGKNRDHQDIPPTD